MSSRHILLPPRVQLRIADDMTGSYPSVARLGDDSRKGTFDIHFDDTTTMTFDEDVTVQYPHLLPSGSNLLQNNTGSSSVSLQATAVVRKGISDQFVRSVRQSESLTPFNEHKHYETHNHGDDPFYMTGSHVSDVGLGFQSPLHSKTKIEIELNATRATMLKLSASLNPDTDGPVGSYPMCYYNFDESAWEVLGRGQAWNIDNDSAASNNTEAQMIGFSPSFHIGTAGGTLTNVSQSGIPLDTFGFPIHPKFHATSSQLLDVSDYIDRPFVLEKAVLEFTASLSGSIRRPESEILYSTFFILNQRSPFSSSLLFPPAPSLLGATVSSSIPASVQLSRGDAGTYVDTSRDLVSWMQVAAAATNLDTSHESYIDFARRELNVFSDASDVNWSGRYVMSGVMKTPAVHQIDVFQESNWFEEHAVIYRYGGRSNTGVASGRGLVSEFVANPVKDQLDPGGSNIFTATVISGTNPYILLPGDRLVFGWQSPIPGDASNFVNEHLPELSLASGPCRLLLYGSQLREGKEFHDTLNQSLTSNAVHEAVGVQPVLDQFDVELRQQFSGSYLGEFLTGSINAVSALNRRVIASTVGPVNTDVVIEQDSGLIYYPQDNAETARAKVPTFSRNISLASPSERFFDTLMPRVEDVITGSAIRFHSSRGNLVHVGVLDAIPYADTNWNRAFPFEPRYSHAARSLNAAKLVRATLNVAGDVIQETVRPGVLVHDDGLYPSGLHILNALNFGLGTAASAREFLLHMYGIGDAASGTVAPANANIGVGVGAGSVFRGFKYGVLNALPQHTKAVFRSSTYGQFRDMLEQRLFGKFFDEQATRFDGTKEGLPGSTVGPVTVRFVEFGSRNSTSPNKTYSSNLSLEATSSLPYFDGVVRNREEPLDLTVIGSTDVVF